MEGNSIALISKNLVKSRNKKLSDKTIIQPLKLFGLKKGK